MAVTAEQGRRPAETRTRVQKQITAAVQYSGNCAPYGTNLARDRIWQARGSFAGTEEVSAAEIRAVEGAE